MKESPLSLTMKLFAVGRLAMDMKLPPLSYTVARAPESSTPNRNPTPVRTSPIIPTYAPLTYDSTNAEMTTSQELPGEHDYILEIIKVIAGAV